MQPTIVPICKLLNVLQGFANIKSHESEVKKKYMYSHINKQAKKEIKIVIIMKQNKTKNKTKQTKTKTKQKKTKNKTKRIKSN